MNTDTHALTTSAVPANVGLAIELYQRIEVVRSVLAPELSDQELQLFAMVAQRSGLDPFAKQIYAVKRAGRVTFQTAIDGYRSTAERTGEYAGSAEPEFGPLVATPFEHPEWARVTVYRTRPVQRIEQSATAYWAEFYPGPNQGQMWQKMPRNQLAKCAEALAFRKAFPFVLSDLYTDTEMDQADARDESEARARAVAALPTAAERLAARRAAVEASEAQSAAPEEDPFVAAVASAQPFTDDGRPVDPETGEIVDAPWTRARIAEAIEQGRTTTVAANAARATVGTDDWAAVAAVLGLTVVEQIA